jgi:hypothetical protein
MDLKLRSDVHQMTDQEVLDRYNEVVRAMEASAASYEHVAVEIPAGKRQIRSQTTSYKRSLWSWSANPRASDEPMRKRVLRATTTRVVCWATSSRSAARTGPLKGVPGSSEIDG